MNIEIVLTFLLLIGLSLVATVDMALGQLSDVGLRRLITEAEERAKLRSSAFLKQVLENRPRFSFAISATIQILLVVIAVLVTSISLSSFQQDRFVLFGLLGGLVLAGIFRQIIPLFISTRDPEGTLLFLLPVIRPLLPLMAFAADPFHRLFDRSRSKDEELVSGDEDEDEDTGDDIQALIDVGEAEGNEDGPISPLVRPVYFIPETKQVSDLLEEMQKAHVQLSMVIDEYGGVAGLVTVEDILEEIVGEIEDEDIGGEELNDIVLQEDGCYEVLGSTEIGKIERLFDMEIEADDFTTIAGLV